MNIFIANESKQSIGGGWTFLRNFTKYAKILGHNVEPYSSKADGGVLFIAGATMTKRDTVQEAKKKGMKIVLRVDNAPRNSRNRNTGTSRLKDFATMADLVVYQSHWAKNYLSPWLGHNGPVIINGADDQIFNEVGVRQPKEGSVQYMFSQFNRDESKRWNEAWYEFSMATRRNSLAHLWIIGNFSPEQIEYNFDFFMGERFSYIGVLEDPANFAEYLRSTDVLLIPYYNDACSNTLIEARLCGVREFLLNDSGATKEIMSAPLDSLTAYSMTKKYLNEFERLWEKNS